MKQVLVNCTGFIGDILFGSSVAEKLKIQYGVDCRVDYLIHLIQPYELLKQNPFIDGVYIYDYPIANEYDQVVRLHGVDHNYPPAVWFQMQAGVENPSSHFKVYTVPEYDEWATNEISIIRDGRPVVAVMDGWMEKTYIFTEEQYKAGVDVPNLGYGGSHRNIPYIINGLKEHLNLVSVGKPTGFNVRTESDPASYTATASLLKYCDAFIGTEGGLANLAYGVGTKTILTGDYVHQLYGWNGVLEKNNPAKLGPIWYEKGHVEIDPYATDNQVISEILKKV